MIARGQLRDHPSVRGVKKRLRMAPFGDDPAPAVESHSRVVTGGFDREHKHGDSETGPRGSPRGQPTRPGQDRNREAANRASRRYVY